MDRHAWWKWLLLSALVAFSLWLTIPPQKKVRLGLDIRGGSSFVVKVDEDQLRKEIQMRSRDLTPEQVENEVRRIMADAQSRALEVLRGRVDRLGTTEPIIYAAADNRIVIQLPGADEKEREYAKTNIQSVAFLEFRMVHERNDQLVHDLFDKGLAPEGYTIVNVGNESYYRRDPSSARKPDAEQAERVARFHIPDAAHEFMLQEVVKDGMKLYRPYFVKIRHELTGENLKSARVDYRTLGQPVVAIEFDARGARKFANLTSDYAPGGAKNPNPNEYRQLAIVLDGKLYSAPVIREPIYGGKAEISGSFSEAEAYFLANILSAGALPAPVKIVETRFVAPSLGSDAVRSGVRAALYGAIAVFFFMMLYYRLSGVVADLALLLNVLLLPLGLVTVSGFLGIFAKEGGGGGAVRLPVMTLPGLAGIALTIGMAVDANILIFERIREELVTGKRLWSAIVAGYNRAFSAIFDSNITTILSAVVLFLFGAGPIRGFAVTLSAGLIVNMYTALVVTKLFFGLLTSKTRVQTLKMLSLFKTASCDFVSRRRLAMLVSLVLIVVTWAVMVVRGVKAPAKIFGVDFTGGTAVEFSFRQKVPVERIRDALAAAGINSAMIQYQREINEAEETSLLIKVGTEPVGGEPQGVIVKRELTEKFPEAGFGVLSEDDVGPQIGRELKRRATWAVIFSLLIMVVYLAIRFEMGFAVAAAVALFHDVLITLGLYSLLGRQVNLPIIAALLTIVGYSVNDTIVVFDRIREGLKLMRNKTFTEVCNLSINQTLTRTVLTSGTTLLTVIMLLIFGGGTLYDFALALLIGIVVGTYSSIFIATPVALLWHRGRRPELGLPVK